jgi:hypothetical protein
MTEVEQPFLAEPDDSETTLIAPRFDAAEAEAAQAVVPLATVSRRRVWPLLLLSAVFGGALSLFGLYLYQRPAPRPQTASPTAAAQPANVAPAPPATLTPEQSAAQVGVPRDNEHAQEPAQSANTAPPAEHAAAMRRAPARKNVERSADAEQEKATRGGVEVRPRLVDETRDIQSPPTATRKHPRNVDRIRDIFEGAPPDQKQ